MDNPKRARSEKPRKQPRECAYVRSPDLLLLQVVDHILLLAVDPASQNEQ